MYLRSEVSFQRCVMWLHVGYLPVAKRGYCECSVLGRQAKENLPLMYGALPPTHYGGTADVDCMCFVFFVRSFVVPLIPSFGRSVLEWLFYSWPRKPSNWVRGQAYGHYPWSLVAQLYLSQGPSMARSGGHGPKSQSMARAAHPWLQAYGH